MRRRGDATRNNEVGIIKIKKEKEKRAAACHADSRSRQQPAHARLCSFRIPQIVKHGSLIPNHMRRRTTVETPKQKHR